MYTRLLGKQAEIINDPNNTGECMDGQAGTIAAVYQNHNGDVWVLLQLAENGRLYPIYCNFIKVMEE